IYRLAANSSGTLSAVLYFVQTAKIIIGNSSRYSLLLDMFDFSPPCVASNTWVTMDLFQQHAVQLFMPLVLTTVLAIQLVFHFICVRYIFLNRGCIFKLFSYIRAAAGILLF